MIGFYVLLVLMTVVAVSVISFLFSAHIMSEMVIINIIIILVIFWVFVGPTIILYYVSKLKQNIFEYENLYEQYNNVLKEQEDIYFKNAIVEKNAKKTIQEQTAIPYEIINRQKADIKLLTEYRDALKKEHVKLKKDLEGFEELKENHKKVLILNKKQKEDISLLKQQNEYLEDKIKTLEMEIELLKK